MSMWTHITACLSIETGMSRKKSELKREVQKVLRQAPKITGSEGNADVFVNVQSGYNFFVSRDCDNCKYKSTLREITDKKDGESYLVCDAPDYHDCSGKYQTCVTISIQGDLRDRTEEQTKKEFDEFLEYIKNQHYYIRDFAMNIQWE